MVFCYTMGISKYIQGYMKKYKLIQKTSLFSSLCRRLLPWNQPRKSSKKVATYNIIIEKLQKISIEYLLTNICFFTILGWSYCKSLNFECDIDKKLFVVPTFENINMSITICHLSEHSVLFSQIHPTTIPLMYN